MDVERISDKNLIALQMMTCSHKGNQGLGFYSDVYAAVSELIERREASGEWKGLMDDGHKGTD